MRCGVRGFCLGLLFLSIFSLTLQGGVAHAATLCVDQAGNDALGGGGDNPCSNSGEPCASIQHAVDQASEGDEILVGGSNTSYTGLNTLGGLSQMAYVTKSVSIRGGYDPVKWEPGNIATTLDAQGGGRVFYIAGDGVEASIIGFTITGGNAQGLGGSHSNNDAGGGVYADQVKLILKNNKIINNASPSSPGGGLYLHRGLYCDISNNTFTGNEASSGSAMFLYLSVVDVISNTVTANNPSWSDGAVYSYKNYKGHSIIRGNVISGNVGSGLRLINDNSEVENNVITGHEDWGIYASHDFSVNASTNPQIVGNHIHDNLGGIYLSGSDTAVIRNNLIEKNSGMTDGPGMYIYGHCSIEGNRVLSNTCDPESSSGSGAGIYLKWGDHLVASNLIANNHANENGPGIYVDSDAHPSIMHNTLVSNTGGDGTAIYVRSRTTPVNMVNNIISGHDVGVHRFQFNTYPTSPITMINTLWHNNGQKFSGQVVEDRLPLSADPKFTSDGTYHLSEDSPAVNGGTLLDVDGNAIDFTGRVDMDGQPRPMETIPDIGADEVAWISDFTPSLSYAGSTPAVLTAGQAAVFNAVVDNLGPDSASDAVLEVTFSPAEAVAALSAKSEAVSDACSVSGNVITCDCYAIPDYLERNLVITCTTAADYGGVLSSQAKVSPGQGVIDSQSDNNQDAGEPVTLILPTPDLYLAKTCPGYVESGGAVQYTLSYGNQGGLLADNVVITDTLPAQVSFVDATGSYTFDSPIRTLTWDMGTLDPEASDTLTINCQANPGLTKGLKFTNKAGITTSNPDDPETNNKTSCTTEVVVKGAAASVSKIAGPTIVEVNELVQYTIWISNDGDTDLFPRVEDLVPDGTEYVPGSLSTTKGSARYDDIMKRILFDTSTPLGKGEELSIVYSVQVVECGGNDCGEIVNAAWVSFSQNPYLDRYASATVQVKCPDLMVTMEGPEHVDISKEPYEWTIDVDVTNLEWNPLDSEAKDVVLTVTGDENAIIAPDKCHPQPDSAKPPVFTWNLGDIENGEDNKKSVRLVLIGDTLSRMSVTAQAKANPGEECSDGAPNKATHVAYGYRYGVDLSLDVKFNHEAENPMADPEDRKYSPMYKLHYLMEYKYENADPKRPPLNGPYVITLADKLGWKQWSFKDVAYEAHSPDHLEFGKYPPAWISEKPLLPGESGIIHYTVKAFSSQIQPGNPEHAVKAQAQWDIRAGNDGSDIFQELEPQSKLVTAEIPLAPPVITYPGNGEICRGTHKLKGLVQPNTWINVFDSQVMVAHADADASGTFEAEVVLVDPGPVSNTLTAEACSTLDPTNCGERSKPVVTSHKEVQLWNPQTSAWRGKDSDGNEYVSRFKDKDTGLYSTTNWEIPGVEGFYDTILDIHSCECMESIHELNVVADGMPYKDETLSAEDTFSLNISQAHNVSLVVTCGNETDGEEHGYVLIDPDGFVFNSTMGWGNVIPGSTVTCVWYNEYHDAWVEWPAHIYDSQINPQITGEDGYFAFFTPPGFYYIQVVDPDGYQSWRSQVVQVISEIVHVNVPYTPEVEDEADVVIYVTPDGMYTLGDEGRQAASAVVVEEGQVVQWVSMPPEDGDVDEASELTKNPVVRILSALDPLANTDGFDSGMLAPGIQYKRRFTTAGVYPYSTGGGASGTVTVVALPVSQEEEQALNRDSDKDGIVDAEESGADGQNSNYDGNGDNVADRFQPHVASLHNLNGDYVTISTSQGVFESVAAIPNPSSQNMPGSIDFGYGFYEFSIKDVPVDAMAQVTVLFPSAPDADTCYIYGPSQAQELPHWQAFEHDAQTGLGAQFSGASMILYMKDAALGDNDLLVNGSIHGMAGPGKKGFVRLSVLNAGNGVGSVTSGGDAINCGNDCKEMLVAGTEVTLNASAQGDSTFIGWEGGACSGTGTCSFDLSQPTTVVARFTQPTHTVTVNQTGTGSGSVRSYPISRIQCPGECQADFTQNTQVELQATSDKNSVFLGWTGGGCTGIEDCVFTMDGAKTVDAEFGPLQAGDANGDNAINLADVILLLKQCANDSRVMDQVRPADITQDNKVDILDALCILQAIAGLR